MEDNFDFSGVESASGSASTSYLNPGEYKVTHIESKLETPQDKNPYLNVTFTANEGIVIRKFYITQKSLPILQYFNETLTDKKITRLFKTSSDVANWFDSIFKGYNAGKTNQVAVIVGRELAAGDKVYARVKDFGFLIPIEKGKDFESREYTEEEIKTYGLSKINDYQGGSPSSSNTLLGSGDGEAKVPTYVREPEPVGSDDLPF